MVGINSVAKAPRNFRCDVVYKICKTNSPTFEREFLDIIQKERPDLILPGRDEGCVFLSDIKSKHPNEFGMLCDKFKPEHKIPNLSKTNKVKGQVFKYLQDNLVLDKDINSLNRKKYWRRSEPKNDM